MKLIYRLSRFARNMRVFFNALDGLKDAGVEVVSITEDFGKGRSKRMGQVLTAYFAEQGAIDASIFTSKSRRENARQGFYNGGPVAFGYETYTARTDGQKERRKLRINEAEAAIVRDIFEWADMGRGGRWIVKTLNDRGDRLRGRKFSNSSVSGILARITYTGVYFDKTVDDDGNIPEPSDWIPVPCPEIIDQTTFDRVNALRTSRNPRRTAPHIAAGTTMLVGIAKCGSPGCDCGMTVRSGKGGQYHYYTCGQRVNKGQKCSTPSMRREVLDDVVLSALETQLLAPDRLEALLSDVLDLSDKKRSQRENELSQARAIETKARSAITNLLMLVEDGKMGPRDPIFAQRLEENRTALTTASARIATLEKQLAKKSAAITPARIKKFGELLVGKLRDDDSTLRKAYARALVSKVIVTNEKILIVGHKAVLENGIYSDEHRLESVVPIFDRRWCPRQDSNLHRKG